MPRPSLKNVRSREILDAFMMCVAKYGLDGSTLERIAEEAGVQRTLLRHYLGNREEMVTQLMDHTLTRFAEMTDEMVADLPETNRWPTLLERLFSNQSHQPGSAAVFQALIAASDQYPNLKDPLMSFVLDFENTLSREIKAFFTTASAEKCEVVASGITSIYFGVDAVLPLSPPDFWTDRQKKAALILQQSLV
ncbi:MAG: TetR/AcrR family transcriptional regulator [Pseudomonadota bacterium]